MKKIIWPLFMIALSLSAAEISVDSGSCKIQFDTRGGSITGLSFRGKSMVQEKNSFTERLVANHRNGSEKEALVEFFEKLDYKLVENSYHAPDYKVVFSVRGVAAFSWLKVTKTYRFQKNGASLKLEYLLENVDRTEHAAGIWCRTFLRRGDNGLDVPNTFYQPRGTEIRQLTHPGRGIAMDEWSLEPGLAFLAVEGNQDHAGTAVLLPRDLLSACYSWFDLSRSVSTLEWFLRQQTIPAGGSVKFEVEARFFEKNIAAALKDLKSFRVSEHLKGEKLWLPEFYAGKIKNLKVSQAAGQTLQDSGRSMNVTVLRQYFDSVRAVRLPADANPERVSVHEINNGRPDDSIPVPFRVRKLDSGEYQLLFKVPGFNNKGDEWVKFDQEGYARGTDGRYLGHREYSVQILLDRAPDRQAPAFDFSGGPDLVYNGSFTKKAPYGDWPDGFYWGWAFRNRKWYEYRDGAIIMTRPGPGDWTAFRISILTREEEKLTVSYRIRNDDRANGIARTLAEFYDKDGKLIKGATREFYRASRKSHDWETKEHSFYVPKGAVKMKFLFQVFGIRDQHVSIDDIRIVPEDIRGVPRSRLERMRDQTKSLWYTPLDSMEKLSPEYVTLHTTWLKPSAFEMPEVLFLPFLRGEMESTKRRTILELAQRMDLSYRYIPLLIKVLNIPFGTMGVVTNEMTCGNELEAYTMECLKSLKTPPKVAVIQGLDFKAHDNGTFTGWLAEIQEKTGAAVLFVNCRNIPERCLGRKIGRPEGMMLVPEMRKTTPEEQDDFLSVYRNGNRKAAVLQFSKDNFYYYARLLPFSLPEQKGELVPAYVSRDFPYWEYTYLPMMKALRWLAGTKTGAEIRKCTADEKSLHFQIRAETDTAAEMEVVYKDLHRRNIGQIRRKVALKAGMQNLRIPMPELPGGTMVAEYRLLNSGNRVFDAGATRVDLPDTSPIRLDFVNADRIYATPQISFSIHVPTPVPGSRLKIRIEDTDFRIVHEETRRTETVNSCSVTLQAPYTKLYRIMIDQIAGKRVVSMQHGEFALTGQDFDPRDLTAMVWHGRPEMTPILKELGFDLLSTGYFQAGITQRAHSNLNLASLSIGCGHDSGFQSIYRGDKPTDPVRNPCYSDPARHRKIQASFLEQSRKQNWKYFQLKHFFLGDEMFLGSTVCYSEHCLKAFRESLKKQYPSLDALNREWESSFRTWNDVIPCQLSELKNKNNLSRWLDHKVFMAGVFAHQNIGFIRHALNRIVPNVRCGISGTQPPGYTYDWAQLMKEINFIAYYGGVQIKLVHDFGGENLIKGQWGCGYVNPSIRRDQYQNAILWRDLLRGANMAAAYACGSTINGDLSLNSNIEVYSRVFREMKQGIAKMVLTSPPAAENVAVLYSQPSLFAALGTIGISEWQNAYSAWNALLEDLHVNCRFVSSEMLTEGLDNGKYKVLILPCALAISPEQTEKIELFVKNGGTVIADFLTGSFDEHGKRGNNARLARLFGIASTDAAPALTGKDLTLKAVPESGIPGIKGSFRIGSGELPVMNVRHTGKGKAILMNMMLNGYQAVLLTGVGGERATQISGAEEFCGNLRRLIGGLLTGSDVRIRCKVTLAGNSRDYPCQTMLRNTGNNYIFGLLKFTEDGNTFDMNSGEDVVVKLPVKGHIYNVREKKYLGSGDEIRLKLVPAWGYLYAILQERITGLEIDSPAAVKPGSGMKIGFRAVAEKGAPGAQTFHISLIRPDGKSPAMYRRNVFSDTGKGEISMQTACNDPAGKWTLRVVNVNSGVTAEKAFVLR